MKFPEMDISLIFRMNARTILKAIQKNPVLNPPKRIISSMRLGLHSVPKKPEGLKVCVRMKGLKIFCWEETKNGRSFESPV